jgi:hypothetical protein
MGLLHESLRVLEHLIDHCRWHLQPEEWDTFTRRLTDTPVKQGYSVREHWTPRMQLDYHWQKLSRQERLLFLREKRHVLRREQEEGL